MWFCQLLVTLKGHSYYSKVTLSCARNWPKVTGVTFSNRFGDPEGEKYSMYHQNPNKIGFLSRFDPLSYHYCEGGLVQHWSYAPAESSALMTYTSIGANFPCLISNSIKNLDIDADQHYLKMHYPDDTVCCFRGDRAQFHSCSGLCCAVQYNFRRLTLVPSSDDE